jgi:transcriptional regulator with XRE-family HTH domain
VADHLEQLAKNLRAAREAAGISQRRLSELSGVDLAHVNRIEAARRDPSTRILVRLASALRTTAADLLSGVE